MSARDYERLDIERFGAVLLETNDLDPIYVALHRMQLPREQLCRWLIAYWCMYHAGSACWLSEQDDFWRHVMTAAKNEQPTPLGDRWPRSAERRHWRGAQAMASVTSLVSPGLDAEALVNQLLYKSNQKGQVFEGALGIGKPDELPFTLIRDRVLEWRGFGPWIAFKVGDMIDRLGLAKVSFEQAEVFMFQTPREAALTLARQKMGMVERAKFKDEEWAVGEVVTYLTNHFNGYLAPPLEDRVVGLQEVETILCKWKSHMGGHYPLGKDTNEIAEGLRPWTLYSDTAAQMRGEFDKIKRDAFHAAV